MPHDTPHDTPGHAGPRRAAPGHSDITPDRAGSALQRIAPGRRAELRALFGPDAERAAGILAAWAAGPLDTASDRK
jgi:hypothetical protein